jgi:hypothetical protein
MTLHGPSIPIRVQPAALHDSPPEPRRDDVPESEPVAPASQPAGEPEPVPAFAELDL